MGDPVVKADINILSAKKKKFCKFFSCVGTKRTIVEFVSLTV